MLQSFNLKQTFLSISLLNNFEMASKTLDDFYEKSSIILALSLCFFSRLFPKRFQFQLSIV